MLVKKRANKWSSTTTNNDDDSVAVETTARLRSEPAKVGVMKKLVKLSERRKKVLDSSTNTMAAASANGASGCGATVGHRTSIRRAFGPERVGSRVCDVQRGGFSFLLFFK